MLNDEVEQRLSNGRFGRVLDDLTLLTVVRAVCEYIAGKLSCHPLAVTQSQFDDARAASGHEFVPRAWRIASNIGAPWGRVKELAFATEKQAAQGLQLRRRSPTEPVPERAVWCLQVIARRKAAAVASPSRYEAERLKLVAEQSQHWLHESGVAEDVLTAHQIVPQFNWGGLLDDAGLPRPVGPLEGLGISHLQALRFFVQELGYLPHASRELFKYTRDKGIALARASGKGAQDMAVLAAELRREWQKNGRWLPPGPAPAELRPPWVVTPIAASEGLRPAQKLGWDVEGCIEALVVALDEAGGAKLTRNQYRRIATGRGDLPGATALDRCAKRNGTSFVKMREEAIKRRLKRLRESEGGGRPFMGRA